jgi:glutathione S-transferase
MSYILIGSKTSPYVRKIRLLLESIPYEFRELNIYEGVDGVELNKLNPINRVPVLQDGEKTIWDSRQIFNYINQKQQLFATDWNDENIITAIDGMLDSGVALALMKRSGMNIAEPYMYVQRQKDRIDSILDYLSKNYLKSEKSQHWNFVSISLLSFIDWAIFRDLADFSKRPEFTDFFNRFKDKPVVQSTDPRL